MPNIIIMLLCYYNVLMMLLCHHVCIYVCSEQVYNMFVSSHRQRPPETLQLIVHLR